MEVLDDVKRQMPQINKAASEVGRNLSRTGILKDIALSAELAGLMLLRQANANIPDVPAGTAVLGIVGPDLLNPVEQFMAAHAAHMGLTQADVEGTIAKLPTSAMAYCLDLTQYESRFCEICRSNGLRLEHFPFVAAFAAVKFVGGGAQIGNLDKKIGFALAFFHIGAGCNTVPYPPPI